MVYRPPRPLLPHHSPTMHATVTRYLPNQACKSRRSPCDGFGLRCASGVQDHEPDDPVSPIRPFSLA